MTDKEYNQCVTQYADNVYRFVFKNLQHADDAKDVIQSSFEKLWINRSAVEFSRSKSYLFTVAYNQMIDHIRKKNKMLLRENFAENAKGAEKQRPDTQRLLNEALATLNENQRSLLMLKDYEGYSYEEIGEIMGLNISQVKVYLHRARLLLRDYIVKVENVL